MTLNASGNFDGTLTALITYYRSHPASSYQKLRFRTKENYDSLLRRVQRDHGNELVGKIPAAALSRWHQQWSEGGQTAMAHSLMTMLRGLATFGVKVLESADCRTLKLILNGMRFELSKPRGEHLTLEHVLAIRAKAHEMGLASIALAQAIQFECRLWQKDVIGEWVPDTEPGESDVADPETNAKWLRGIRWEEIDQNRILRHTTSRAGQRIEVDLNEASMVLDELRHIGVDLEKGPVIIFEGTGLPYQTHQFRRTWRLVADAAGIPRSVRNADSLRTVDRVAAKNLRSTILVLATALEKISKKSPCETVEAMAHVAAAALTKTGHPATSP